MTENQYIRLLPNYSKKIGVGSILAIVTLCIISFTFDWFEDDRVILLEATRVITILSLLTITLSKDKIEDELVMYVRLKALVFAFIVGVLLSITLPTSNYLFTGVYTQIIDANQILISIFILYFLSFFFLKRKR